MVENAHNRMHVRVTGRVQGVGFRWFVLATGRRLGLTGWVRNNPDGSVEVEAAGPATELASFRARLADGPPAARVQHVIDLPASAGGLPDPFAIKH
jgi:acylphosphatase